MKQNMTRRKLLKVASIAGVLPCLVFGRSQAQAQTPQVDPNSGQAKALEYVHKSAIADKDCANCQLYSGAAGDEWGPCAIFPGQTVASAGW